MAKKNSDDSQKQAADPTFSPKWAKKLSSDWMSTAESYTTDELKKKIVQWEQAISSTEKDEDADMALNGIKDKMSDLKVDLKDKSKVYKESIDICQAQIKYAVHLLESRGIEVK